MNGALRALCGALSCGLFVLAGCGSDGKDPSPTVTASPEATAVPVPADVPLTGPNLRTPDEKPPVMPAAALVHDKAGAVAFAEFFIKTLDWGYATTSSAYMRHYFEDSCDRCKILAGDFDSTRHDGSHFRGNRIDVKKTDLQSSPAGQGAELAPNVHMRVSTASVVDTEGKPSPEDPPIANHSEIVSLAWRSVGWTVVNMAGANS